jgi:formamidopyrimidine-DNA glycosylase
MTQAASPRASRAVSDPHRSSHRPYVDMPELPDVETFKRYLDATSLHQVIRSARVLREGILQDVTRQRLQRALHGRRLCGGHRHGKYLSVRLDDDARLVLHFGMTGFLRYWEDEAPPPRHARMVLRFDNGHRLAYDCRRMLGKVRLVEDFARFVAERGLGADALRVDRAAFDEGLRGRRGAIKSTLMNQSFVAGLGNVYSDEILFQARIHPRTRPVDLTAAARGEVFRDMRRVLRKAIEVQADPQRMPRSWLLPQRRPGAACPRCSGTLEHTVVGGRTAYFCPACQRLRKHGRKGSRS